MPFLFAVALIVIVHLATGLGAWFEVGLLSDDREMIGGAILRHRGEWSLEGVFLPPSAAEASRALYRPFVDLLFWFEQPYFGTRAFGYHVVNSLLHCCTATLWFVMLRRWSSSYMAALAGAVIFVGWPGHSEATHWIAARSNVLSVLVMSFALLLHDLGATRMGAASRWPLLVAAGLFGAVAVGCKESAVFVLPLAALVSWLHAPSLRVALQRTLPMAVAVFGWLCWRRYALGTWGSGTNYGWKLERVTAQTCADWGAVLLAPLHSGLQHPLQTTEGVVLAVIHGVLLLLGLAAVATVGGRRVAAVAVTLLLMGYAAGVGLERLDLSTLENVRYTYEPALGVAALFGAGLALMPQRVAVSMTALVVVVHALGLAHNRRPWIQASAIYERMRGEVEARARETQQPVRVVDAPGVYDGAFALLNGYTEFLFWQQTAAPGTNLRGSVTSDFAWWQTMGELATAAAQRRRLDASVVRWSDGALLPLEIDPQWPAEVVDGVVVDYARIGRRGVVADTKVPVQVRLTSSKKVRLAVGDQEIVLAGKKGPQPALFWLPVHADIQQIEADLVVACEGVERRYALGVRDVVAR